MSETEKKPFYKKWWGILIIVIVVFAIIQGIFGSNVSGCDCVKEGGNKQIGLSYNVTKYNNCIRKFGTYSQMEISCANGK